MAGKYFRFQSSENRSTVKIGDVSFYSKSAAKNGLVYQPSIYIVLSNGNYLHVFYINGFIRDREFNEFSNILNF